MLSILLTDRQSGVNVSEFDKQSNIQWWKQTYADFWRLLCASFTFSQTWDGIILNMRAHGSM